MNIHIYWKLRLTMMPTWSLVTKSSIMVTLTFLCLACKRYYFFVFQYSKKYSFCTEAAIYIFSSQSVCQTQCQFCRTSSTNCISILSIFVAEILWPHQHLNVVISFHKLEALWWIRVCFVVWKSNLPLTRGVAWLTNELLDSVRHWDSTNTGSNIIQRILITKWFRFYEICSLDISYSLVRLIYVMPIGSSTFYLKVPFSSFLMIPNYCE